MLNDNKTIFYLIIACEAVDRFIYFGLLTILVLFLTQQFHYDITMALASYSAYVSLTFGLPILGGLLADRFLGNYYAIVLGISFSIVANLLLSLNSPTLFLVGLAIFLIGSGLFKPSSSSQIGLLFQDESEKHSAYTLFYIAMNVGAILGPIVFGILGSTWGWTWGFLLVAFVQASMLIRLLFNKKVFYKNSSDKFNLKSSLVVSGLLVLLILSIYLLLEIQQLFNIAVIIFIVTSIYFLYKLIRNLNHIEKKNFISIIKLLTFGLMFFAVSLQLGSSITLFIQHEIDRTVMGLTIPTPVFSALDPLFVVLMAPVISQLWKILKHWNIHARVNYKIALGLFFGALAMLIFSFIGLIASSYKYLSLLLIVLGNLCLGAGEISLSPAILTAISKKSPKKMHSTVMGFWYLFVSFAGYLSGTLAKFSQTSSYSVYFGIIFILASIIFIFSFWIKLE